MAAQDDQPIPDAQASAATRGAVTRTVWQTEALAEWVPRGLFLLLWLVPAAIGLGGGIANAVVVGIVMGLVTPLVIRAVTVFILEPIRAIRYQQAARLLDSQLYLFGPTLLIHRSWPDPSPGVLAVTPDNDLILCDPSTGYAFARMPASAIRTVTVERHATQVMRTRHGSRFTLGGGGTVFGAISFGGRSRSITRTIETATLELRYRHPHIAPIRTAVIGFGTDRRAADDLRVALTDIREQAAAAKARPSQRSFLE